MTVLRDRDPLVHRVSDIFWRYFEENLMMRKYSNRLPQFTPKHIRPDYYKEYFEIVTDSEVTVKTNTLLVPIATGVDVPFVVLLIGKYFIEFEWQFLA